MEYKWVIRTNTQKKFKFLFLHPTKMLHFDRIMTIGPTTP